MLPPLDPAQEEVREKLEDLRLTLSRKKNPLLFWQGTPEKQGLYIWGGVGRGKTMLMDEFYADLPASVPKRRVHFHEFMIGVHDDMHWARQQGDADRALLKYTDKVAQKARVLCFDEFHVSDIADAMILGRLFTAIFERGVIVVATSNYPPHKLYEGGLQRDRFLPFISVIKEKLEVVELKSGPDYRLLCLRDTGVWFQPLGEKAQKKADEVFRLLTGGTPPHEETLTVKGRVLRADRAAKGVARFSFDQLCAQPLGAEDYLAIASAYHTVFLEDVPKLSEDRRNEAKRLMTLVDAFYDRVVKLVVTADSGPEGIYGGSDHAFDFRRTVSRLVEMQGSEYLNK